MMDELMKSYMNIMADRDAAIRERNISLVEKKKALVDRDIAIMQRDAVVAERDNAILERDNVFAQLHYQTNSINREKHIQFIPHLVEAAYNPREVPFSDTFSNSEATSETATSKKAKTQKTKQAKTVPVKKSPSKPLRKGKKTQKNSSTTVWNSNKHDSGDGSSWRDDLALNQSSFEERALPVPVCSCTGKLQPCYKWGKGGWQSACCTTTISMYPLPQTGNKRHTRIGGRKMSGNVYSKLLGRLASEGHDLSSPVDLKEHWCRHGTNRYITIK